MLRVQRKDPLPSLHLFSLHYLKPMDLYFMGLSGLYYDLAHAFLSPVSISIQQFGEDASERLIIFEES